MARAITLLVAILVVAACAASAETTEWTTDVEPLPQTSATPVVAAPEIALAAAAPAVLGAEGLAPGIPIQRPDDFPSLGELHAWVASYGLPHPRARIASSLAVVGGLEELGSQGTDTSGLDQSMTITYYDGLVIWDAPTGYRQIYIPERGTFYPMEDGRWMEAAGFEWPVFGPLSDWPTAQAAAVMIFDAGPRIIGYELIAGAPTVRLQIAGGGESAQVWLDETGAVLRIVQDFSGPDGASRWLGVWDVVTLAPQLTGPLPDDITG